MHELKVNLKNGDLFLNKLPFQFKTEKFYLESIKNIKDMEDKPLLVNGYHKYGGYDICFADRLFGPEFIYINDVLHSKYFIFGEGECIKNGWGATEEDQRKDRKFLTSELTKFFKKKPEKKLKYRDIFIYEWGEITVSMTHRDFYIILNFNYY